MRTILKYAVVLLVGLLLGYVFFDNDSEQKDVDTAHNSEKEKLWTCAMHPHVLQKEEGKCPICGMDLTAAIPSEIRLEKHQLLMTERAQALANVQTTIVGADSSGGGGLTLSGEIVANEKANATQTAHFAGRIEKLYVNSLGETVKKGQLLALVYSPELLSAQQELLTASTMKKTQPQLYAAVRKKLQLWKLSPKQIDQIETSGKAEANFKIYANVSGVVSEKLIESGDHVMEGHALFKIANLQTVWAVFDVYESQISQLSIGQKIALKSAAYPDKIIKTVISFIEPTMDTSTQTLKVRVVLDNSKSIWKPGMYVTGVVQEIVKTNVKKKVSVPRTAVLWTGKQSIVYVKPNPEKAIFEMREVTLGMLEGPSYEIITGLTAGEIVVTNGAFVLDAEAQLQGKKSMMNQDVQ